MYYYFSFHFFSPGGTRENELMQALQILLDKINSGNIPINHDMIERSKAGGASYRGGGQPGSVKVRMQLFQLIIPVKPL